MAQRADDPDRPEQRRGARASANPRRRVASLQARLKLFHQTSGPTRPFAADPQAALLGEKRAEKLAGMLEKLTGRPPWLPTVPEPRPDGLRAPARRAPAGETTSRRTNPALGQPRRLAGPLGALTASCACARPAADFRLPKRPGTVDEQADMSTGRRRGRPTIHEQAMTPTERQQRWRAKVKAAEIRASRAECVRGASATTVSP